VFGTNKMISACHVLNKGFNLFDYDTRATNNGFTHEVASGHSTTKRGHSVSAIHGSTTIIADHDDTLFNLYIGDFSITIGTFPKYFVSSNLRMTDMNYIESTALIIAGARDPSWNIEIHNTN
jgi:hypothetical protein